MKTPDGDQILAVYRLSDGASIPFDEGNMDYIEYKVDDGTHHKNPNKLDKYQKILYTINVFSILVDLGLKILPCGGGSVLVVTQREGILPFLFYKSLFKG